MLDALLFVALSQNGEFVKLNMIQYLKRIPNNGEHQKYIQEDHHPAIISRETFRAVQEMRESRSNIERHADGTVTRKAKRYTGKKE